MKSGTSATLSRALNADLDATLMQYQSLVRRLADQMIAKLPANVDIADLISVGLVGLAKALSHFDAAHDGGFEIFATKRIRSAMLEELRGSNYLSRGTREQQRSIQPALVGAIKALPERELHVMSMLYEHDVNLKEIAAVLGVDESPVCKLHRASIATALEAARTKCPPGVGMQVMRLPQDCGEWPVHFRPGTIHVPAEA